MPSRQDCFKKVSELARASPFARLEHIRDQAQARWWGWVLELPCKLPFDHQDAPLRKPTSHHWVGPPTLQQCRHSLIMAGGKSRETREIQIRIPVPESHEYLSEQSFDHQS